MWKNPQLFSPENRSFYSDGIYPIINPGSQSTVNESSIGAENIGFFLEVSRLSNLLANH
jgi:hypothetical protein